MTFWDGVLLASTLLFFVAASIRDYQRSPMCGWCNVRHYGRCIWNPRAGRLFANVNDGHYDYNNPNA